MERVWLNGVESQVQFVPNVVSVRLRWARPWALGCRGVHPHREAGWPEFCFANLRELESDW